MTERTEVFPELEGVHHGLHDFWLLAVFDIGDTQLYSVHIVGLAACDQQTVPELLGRRLILQCKCT